MCLASNESKECLIEFIAEEIIAAASKCKDLNVIVTAKCETPTQSINGVTLLRNDMKTNFDEADYIIPQQVDTAISEGCKSITVLSADTDVFVLLCHFYYEKNWISKVYMSDFTDETTTICIQSSVKKHKAIIPSLLAAHALSGCDTVPSLFGIGKAKVIATVKTNPLIHIGKMQSSEEMYMPEGETFIAKCYGISKESDSSKNRYLSKVK